MATARASWVVAVVVIGVRDQMRRPEMERHSRGCWRTCHLMNDMRIILVSHRAVYYCRTGRREMRIMESKRRRG